MQIAYPNPGAASAPKRALSEADAIDIWIARAISFYATAAIRGGSTRSGRRSALEAAGPRRSRFSQRGFRRSPTASMRGRTDGSPSAASRSALAFRLDCGLVPSFNLMRHPLVFLALFPALRDSHRQPSPCSDRSPTLKRTKSERTLDAVSDSCHVLSTFSPRPSSSRPRRAPCAPISFLTISRSPTC